MGYDSIPENLILLPVRLEVLRERAPRRPSEFIKDYEKAAKWITPDGAYLWLDRTDAARLKDKYREFYDRDKREGRVTVGLPVTRNKSTGERGNLLDNYKGQRARSEILAELRLLFKFETSPINEPMAALRQKMETVLNETAMSPCRLKSLISEFSVEYINLLNEYEHQ